MQIIHFSVFSYNMLKRKYYHKGFIDKVTECNMTNISNNDNFIDLKSSFQSTFVICLFPKKNHLCDYFLLFRARVQPSWYFPSRFSSSTYWNRRRFFHVVAGSPSRALLTRIGDRSPFGHVGEKEHRLFFMLKQQHAPRRPHFFGKSLGKVRC